jgi:hypothetical protein
MFNEGGAKNLSSQSATFLFSASQYQFRTPPVFTAYDYPVDIDNHSASITSIIIVAFQQPHRRPHNAFVPVAP